MFAVEHRVEQALDVDSCLQFKTIYPHGIDDLSFPTSTSSGLSMTKPPSFVIGGSRSTGKTILALLVCFPNLASAYAHLFLTRFGIENDIMILC